MRFVPLPRPETAELWDLSQTWETDAAGVRYKLFGDTLLSEAIDGSRRWYGIADGSVLFIREESTSMYALPDSMLPSSAFGCGGQAGKFALRERGLQDNLYDLSRLGDYETVLPVHGRIVTNAGDTITASMTVERESYYEKISPLYEILRPDDNTDSLTRRDVVVYRWFVAGERTPVAVQRRVDEILPGNLRQRTETAYVLDFRCRREDVGDNTEDAARRMLAGASVWCDGGVLRIGIESGGIAEISVDLMSEGGISYFHDVYGISGYREIEIAVGGLLPGRYIAAIACRGVAERRVVHIR